MQKKTIFLAIALLISIGLIGLLIYNPTRPLVIASFIALGTMVYQGINSITGSVWFQKYGIIIMSVLSLITGGLLVYKGRDIYDSVRGIVRYRATDAAKTVTLQREPSEPESSYQPQSQAKTVVQEEPQQQQEQTA